MLMEAGNGGRQMPLEMECSRMDVFLREVNISADELQRDSTTAELVRWIEQRGKTLFLILIKQGDRKKPYGAFQTAGFGDEKLRMRPTWPYLAPVFDPKQFEYKLLPGCVLPIQILPGHEKKGSFSLVYKAEIHHSNRPQTLQEVAVKEITVRPGDKTERVWESEAKAQRAIREIKHPRLIRCVAALHGLAEGLWTLHNYSGRENPADDEGDDMDTKTALDIADEYIKAISHESIRHGDLKPENIVRFPEGKNTLGKLKTADLGLAKRHAIAKENRLEITSTKYGTALYEAPESQSQAGEPRPRLYDVWSMACIVFEFVVDGNDEVNRPLSAVRHWIDHILQKDPEYAPGRDSAIKNLLTLVKTKLLVVDLDPLRRTVTVLNKDNGSKAASPMPGSSVLYRVTAGEFCTENRKTRIMANEQPGYSPLPNSQHHRTPPPKMGSAAPGCTG
ncbi:kinase-like domain-containing protein [Podospora didyma]|uniref:Kinase-like domain-containing protein n=1 Tax=Podospora didyma TaxID=330526 RepID=A0AAE0NPI0_9PEZI|nr:kinase-like domain-containing protein [Podospora didyma]